MVGPVPPPTPPAEAALPSAAERLRDALALAAPGAPAAVAPGDTVLNQLPFARRAVALLAPSDPPPLGFRDGDGARHPAQPIRAGDGSLVAMACAPELGALAIARLEPVHEPVAGPRWEVSPRVLDNGRVRAEFDASGALMRLSWDGVYAEFAGPAGVVRAADGAAAGDALQVLEEGPVVATLAGSSGIAWSLHAHEDVLRLAVDTPLRDARIEFPLPDRGARLTVGDSTGEQPGLHPQASGRWVAVRDGAGRGIAVLAEHDVAAAIADGVLRLTATPGLRCALGDASRATRRGGLTQAALALAPFALAQAAPSPARWRWWGPANATALWAAPAAGWAAEVLVAETAGACARVWIYPLAGRVAEAVEVDAAGTVTGKAGISREGDAVELDLAPRQVARIRWR